ncbi:MAG: hypothetical protein WBH31_06335 [Promethearchaeia archaeon]
MANKITLVITIIIIFGMSLIISIPIFIISTTLAPYGIIEESIPFYYNPSNSSFMKELNINTDIGEIEIRYTYEPVDYSARVELNIGMIGSGLAEKSYSDYFNVVWENASGSVNFTVEFKASIDQNELLSLINYFDINVALKAEVICDINVIVNVQGGVNIVVPWGISIGSILTNISNGDIQFDLSNCIVDGNITGFIQIEGDLELISNNVQYIHNNAWSLNTRVGDIVLEIIQNVDINGNISGTITHEQGYISFKYQDNRMNNGAYFTVYYYEADLTLSNEIDESVGFYSDHSDEQPIVYLWCYDYPSKNNYNLLFNNSNGLYQEFDLDA